jgi:DNA ligase-1
MVLNKIKKLSDLLKDTSSSLDKVKILKTHLEDDDLKKLVMYVYNPYYQFYITSSVCEKNSSLKGKSFNDVFELLDNLRKRIVTGHEAIGCVNSFIEKNPDHKDIVFNILDKDLKTRIAEKTINKAIPGLIPEFEVALAEKHEKDLDFTASDYYAARKLDGCRCIVVVDEHGNATSYSRQGKIFTTLSVLEKEVQNLGLKNIVLDGEVCVFKDGIEDFQGIMKLIRKKDYSIPFPVYKIFDFLSAEEFYNKKGKINFKDRLALLEKNIPKDNKFLHILHQEIVKDDDHFKKLLKEADDSNWEGLMLRLNSTYKGKRTKELLKCKTFFDAEYVVKDVEFGPIHQVVDGKEIEEVMLSCVTIEHKGFPVRVGSGWNVEERREYYKNPKKIIGKTITVKYFAESTNQDGGFSLRFPVFKCLYDGERDV